MTLTRFLPLDLVGKFLTQIPQGASVYAEEPVWLRGSVEDALPRFGESLDTDETLSDGCPLGESLDADETLPDGWPLDEQARSEDTLGESTTLTETQQVRNMSWL